MNTINFLILLCIILTSVTSAQVASLCRPNERFLSCGGCQKTCRQPNPPCAAVCREGCFCPEDLVRNDTGDCVPLSACPSTNEAYQYDTSEPRSGDLQCPHNEEYRFCEPCVKTCDNPNPICPAVCARGCFCKGDLVRDRDGKCVKVESCMKNEISNYVPKEPKSCGMNQVYRQCGGCERTCSNTAPLCLSQCVSGCFCKEGYVKGPANECIAVEKCPKASTFIAEFSLLSAHEMTVEDCAPEEEYLSCGWCEPTCSELQPSCPIGVCTRGCLCRPPLVRHYSGICVETKNCLPQKCSDPNEEFVCRYGCETRCDRRDCSVRPRGCSLGCHCKLGLLRNASGKCVLPNNC